MFSSALISYITDSLITPTNGYSSFFAAYAPLAYGAFLPAAG